MAIYYIDCDITPIADHVLRLEAAANSNSPNWHVTLVSRCAVALRSIDDDQTLSASERDKLRRRVWVVQDKLADFICE